MFFLAYLNVLTQSIAITDSMFNFGKVLTKYAITFDLTEIEKKYRYLVRMKFCCASNAAIKTVKISRKKINFYPNILLTKIAIFFLKKYRYLETIRYIFGFWRFFPIF